MLDELLDIFERDRDDRGADTGRRRGARGFFDRFNDADDDDERARRGHPDRDGDFEYDEDGGWYDRRRSRW